MAVRLSESLTPGQMALTRIALAKRGLWAWGLGCGRFKRMCAVLVSRGGSPEDAKKVPADDAGKLSALLP